jgi:dTDP-4-amino-4,6-dideoxy-D-galactose acyltransferase
MEEICSILPWDSTHWGFPVARLNRTTLDPETTQTALQWCEKQHVRCLYFAADGLCRKTLNYAWQSGFKFVDLRVDMDCAAIADSLPDPVGCICRDATIDDLPALEELARAAHGETRFFKDTEFDRNRAGDLYVKWIRREFEERRVFVAVDNRAPDRVFGYASAERKHSQEGRIGLVAVAEGSRGKGVGVSLVQHTLSWFHAQGSPIVRVATQGTNVAALRLYEKCRFRAVESTIWFHRWFPVYE